MKLITRLLLIAFASVHLFAASMASATKLSDRPLRAAVLAKPNVIFGLDDSGSMDDEILVYTDNGAFWWDAIARSGSGIDPSHPNVSLRQITSLWFNASGDSTSRWRQMSYLFPNGVGLGTRRSGDEDYKTFAVLPTDQLAHVRWSGVYRDAAGAYRSAPSDPALSPLHNSLFYNPMVTYRPWAPAHSSKGPIAPGNADPTAVQSHPIYGQKNTLDLTRNIPLSTATDTVFTALPGMVVPAGAITRDCDDKNQNCAAWSSTPTTTSSTVPAGRVVRVALAYYAATYWVKEPCTVPSRVDPMVADCSRAPDGTTLKRYQIKPGVSFPSGRSYAAEMQNFANWFQYYRKRKLILAASMGSTLENLTGLRLGVVAFNDRRTVTMYDADAVQSSSNRLRVAGWVYEMDGAGGTPTREALEFIGQQFRRTDRTSSDGSFAVTQFACQRNNAFIVTDGFASATKVTMPQWDSGKSASTWGAGAPYENIFPGSLADLALRLYTNNNRPDLARGVVPKTDVDKNVDQHINTYALSLGSRGTMFYEDASVPPTTVPAWPSPDRRGPSSVDDLWHAAINGRGRMYLATTQQETAQKIQAGLNDILGLSGAQGGIAVSSINLAKGDGRAYLGSYTAAGWTGDLTANKVDAASGEIAAKPIWSASSVLSGRNWRERFVFTSLSSNGVEFTDSNIGKLVTPVDSAVGSAKVVDYLRGDRSAEGELLRPRAGLVGAVINARPVVARKEGVVYLASGEGMLHAFDSETGHELWGYVPQEVLAGIGASSRRGWTYRTLMDATPRYGELSNGKKLLVAGLGSAGRSYYALDVTSPRADTQAQAASQFKWRFPEAGDRNAGRIGYTVGTASIVRTVTHGDVVLVTSGYNNGEGIGDGLGRLWMLDANSGAVLKTFRTTSGTTTAEAGLAHVSPYREDDGTVRYVYGGDLLGNLWKFDLATQGSGELDGVRLTTFTDVTGKAQPVTAAPELALINGQRIILVGTGRLLSSSDFGSTLRQSFYAIADGEPIANPRSTLTARTLAPDRTSVSGIDVNWTTNRGWYLDLPSGEQSNTTPVLSLGMIVFTTNMQGATDCSESSYVYLLDSGTGKKVPQSEFVSDVLSKTQTVSEVIVVIPKSAGSAVFPKAQCRLADGSICERNLPPREVLQPTKSAWREVRRQ